MNGFLSIFGFQNVSDVTDIQLEKKLIKSIESFL